MSLLRTPIAAADRYPTAACRAHEVLESLEQVTSRLALFGGSPSQKRKMLDPKTMTLALKIWSKTKNGFE